MKINILEKHADLVKQHTPTRCESSSWCLRECCVVMPSNQQCLRILQPCAEGLPELERTATGHRCRGLSPPPAVSCKRSGSRLDLNKIICAQARIPHVRCCARHRKLHCWTGAHCVHSARTVQWNQQVQPAQQHKRISDIAHAKLLSGRVQLMDGLWIGDDSVRTNDKFMVKLSDSSCSCTFPNCIHLMAVRFAAGLNVPKPKRTNWQGRQGRPLSCYSLDSANRRRKISKWRKRWKKCCGN